MKAMVLAAGRGERMGKLTQQCPKPLLSVAGKPLLQHHLERLQAAGFKQVVVNAFYLADQIQHFLQQLTLSMEIQLSIEPELLDTAGGIHNALPLLGDDPFVVINSDVWCEYPLAQLPQQLDGLGHLVLVSNPAHNPEGDFGLEQGRLLNKQQNKNNFTFSGISVLSPKLFQNCEAGVFPLAPLLRQAADQNKLSAEKYSGYWVDVGTPERLQQVETKLQEQSA